MSDETNTNKAGDTNGQPSTLKSYIDSASGAVQSAIGAITGNTAEQVCFYPAFGPPS
jgi:uncharacterized protein YjbJ (UPF0337 family)